MIDKNLEERLKELDPQSKIGKVVIETQQVADVSAYLTAEKIYHCSLPKHNVIVVGFTDYAEMQKLDNLYAVSITDKLRDNAGQNALRKLDLRFRFESNAITKDLFPGSAPMHDVYNVKDEQVSGMIQHTPKLDGVKYGVHCLDGSRYSTFHGTFETVFDIVLDKEVYSVEASTKYHLCRTNFKVC